MRCLPSINWCKISQPSTVGPRKWLDFQLLGAPADPKLHRHNSCLAPRGFGLALKHHSCAHLRSLGSWEELLQL